MRTLAFSPGKYAGLFKLSFTWSGRTEPLPLCYLAMNTLPKTGRSTLADFLG